MQRSNTLQTVERTFLILEQFTPEHPARSLTELAALTGLNKAVILRILNTLKKHQYVIQDSVTKQYRLGLKLVDLSQVVLNHLNLRFIALPVMQRLVSKTGESSFLNVCIENESVCIEKVENNESLRITYPIGRHTPLHVGAPARLLLAFLPPNRREEIIAAGLPRFTERTITDPQRLREVLEQIRRDGYAFSEGELTPGVAAGSAPVFDGKGQVIAALSVSGPAVRFGPDRLDYLIQATVQSAQEISSLLQGWVGQIVY